MEAIIAAIYLDRGIKAVEKVILKWFEPYFNLRSLSKLGANPKSKLQEICQKTYKTLPIYKTIQKKGKFISRVRIKNNLVEKGEGFTKRNAEEIAAKKLISEIKNKKRFGILP